MTRNPPSDGDHHAEDRGAETGQERRDRSDRRAQPTPMFSRYWLRGRRRGARRTDEGLDSYVDRYTPREWMLALGIVLLSVADLVMTLLYIQAGGEEANPVMAWALEHGWETFSFVKLGITIVGVMVLLVHVRFRRVRWALDMIFGLYCVLLIYHTWLRMQLPG